MTNSKLIFWFCPTNTAKIISNSLKSGSRLQFPFEVAVYKAGPWHISRCVRRCFSANITFTGLHNQDVLDSLLQRLLRGHHTLVYDPVVKIFPENVFSLWTTLLEITRQPPYKTNSVTYYFQAYCGVEAEENGGSGGGQMRTDWKCLLLESDLSISLSISHL